MRPQRLHDADQTSFPVFPAAQPDLGAVHKENIRAHYNRLAPEWDRWRQRNRYYHRHLEEYLRFIIPAGASVCELGCGQGDLLAALEPRRGLGIDLSPALVERARQRHPQLEFQVADCETLRLEEQFEYVVLSNVIGDLYDVQQAFESLRRACQPDTRVIITYYNYLWEPVLKIGERLRLKMPQPTQNWLPLQDIEGMLAVVGFETIKRGYRLLCPKFIPALSWLLNKIGAKLPGLWKLCLIEVIVARPQPISRVSSSVSCTVVIPCRNEKGNIADAVRRTPEMGRHTEILFVDGNSSDGTVEAIHEQIRLHPERDIKLLPQGEGRGKGDAVRKGFAAATGEVLMILDGDLTVSPEELPKFFYALVSGKGEFINGSRLVYQMENQAMRFLNLLGNKFFSRAFTYLLEQRFRDTLCGTKVLYKRDYAKIAANRHYFGDFDPFGDFDLLFGAAKLNLKIVEIPVRYHNRTYGETKISRFTHGWLLIKMCVVAYRKLKWI
jgi:SAM-dependent methyltransferase